MPRMKELDIDFISLVNKGANKQTVKIYKSDDEPLDSDDEEYRGFFNVLKSFFKKEKIAKEAPMKPTDFNQIIGQVETEERIRQARWALMDVLENILDNAFITDKATAMGSEIDKFKSYVVGTVNTVGIAKALEQVRSIKKYESEEEDMKVEDIKKMLDEALNPIKDEIKILKGEEIPEGKVEGEDTKEPTQEELIAKAIEEATKPLMNELTELKKSRKPSSALTDTNNEATEEKPYMSAFKKAFDLN